jgi:hypothetical protein
VNDEPNWYLPNGEPLDSLRAETKYTYRREGDVLFIKSRTVAEVPPGFIHVPGPFVDCECPSHLERQDDEGPSEEGP